MAKLITTEALTSFLNGALIEALNRTTISQGALYSQFKDHEDEVLPTDFTQEILRQAIALRTALVSELTAQIQAS